MVTITYAPLGPQYGAMQSIHYVRDDTVWLNMIFYNKLQLVDLCGTREIYKIERCRVKEC